MQWQPIRKPTTWATPPNLVDYDAARRDVHVGRGARASSTASRPAASTSRTRP